jgi:CAAX prenyl protease-like protein
MALYAAKLALTAAALLWAMPTLKKMPLRPHWAAVPVGIVGGVLWVLVCQWNWQVFAGRIGLGWFAGGGRAAFDPWVAAADYPTMVRWFLVMRFSGLVLVVPIMEEFFLRGFLVRYVESAEWRSFPVGKMSAKGWAAVAAYAVLTHPAEAPAAILWFLLISGLVYRTRSLGDGIVAHGLSNLVLGCYVLGWQDWRLW